MNKKEAIQRAIEIIKRRRMRMVKVFTLNGNGKIEMTEAELKKLLDDVYWDGYRDGGKNYTWSSPAWSPYTTTSTSKSITIDASNLPKAVSLTKENTQYINGESE